MVSHKPYDILLDNNWIFMLKSREGYGILQLLEARGVTYSSYFRRINICIIQYKYIFLGYRGNVLYYEYHWLSIHIFRDKRIK